MKVLILLTCLLVAVYARTAKPELRQWQLFKNQHGKTYDNTNEEARRMKIFLDNKAFIAAHNKRFANGEVTYTVALNKFADMTNQEFVAMYNNYRANMTKSKASNLFNPASVTIPDHVDWRDSGLVTDVKDQQQCGGCWAFSATGSIEGQHKLATGELVSLSEEQLLDCATKNHGCGGGNMDLAFDYIIGYGGIDSEASYPYTGAPDTCKASKANIVATISDYTDLPFGDESALTAAIATVGPISVGLDASHLSFQLYSGGVYNEPACSSTQLDHAALAVGYDSLNGQDYYIVKNSWSTDWGLDGYIYMSRYNDNNCGIASYPSYPIV